jgi:hypothetical protein
MSTTGQTKMNASYYHVILASTYGSGSYDSSTYNGGAGTTTNTAAGSSGSLSNTGIAIVGIVSLAAAILLVAMVVRIWKRPSKRVTSDEPQG